MNRRKIGVSTVSLIPRSWGPGGLFRAGRVAVDAGLNCLQLTPLLGITKFELKRMPQKFIVSYEGDWNNYSFPEAIVKAVRGEPKHLLNNALFGTKIQVNHKVRMFRKLFPEAFGIDLPGQSSLIETAPVNGIGEEHYTGDLKDVVLDTWHVREDVVQNINPFVDKLVRWQKLSLIHLQTRNRQEFEDFLQGRETFLQEMLCRTASSNVPIIIELSPFWIRTKRVEWLQFTKRAIERCLR